ncbi:hypothetical protein EDC30_112104 [Paucimonas lemoignei]|uniref:Transposase n=1 Tax=Paucimonas lemoignei TaxID=29443 RepID=A0A4V2UIA0_PAULE|nr:hypothetical protein EDC30_112104 [Paucimonas lemoignei]
MKKRFTEEQIIGILEEAEAGAKVAELDRNSTLPMPRITTERQNSAE